MPQIIFSNNHLLVVNKPPGWKSQPGNGVGINGSNNIQSKSESNDPKCLLSYLKSQSMGGGSMKDFLMPTHRLDQPCTGVLIFAKNAKAASRVQVAWSKKQVKKCYWVVVEGGGMDKNKGGGSMLGLELLQSRSSHILDPETAGNTHTYRLSAILKNTGGKVKDGKGDRSKHNAGGSVAVKPLLPGHSSSSAVDGRICHIEWKHLLSVKTQTSASTRHLLSVTTDTGAKHQVRALLALAGGAPIAGDLRYGNNNMNQQSKYQPGRVEIPLPDGSVALHARSVFLPTVSLGGMEFLKNESFVASIPKKWRDFFGIREDDVKKLF
jgi:23S rRNA-/tRNA-specific pseudouridylate synthase